MSWGAVAAAGATVIGGAISKNKSAGSTSAQADPPWLANAKQSAISKATDISNRPFQGYQPGLNINERKAGDLAGSMSGAYQPLLDRASVSSDVGMQKFMNPYTQQVTDNAVRGINTSYDQQQAGLNRKRGMIDAFGTNRSSMLDAQLQRGRAQQISDTTASNNAAGFDKALAAAQNERSADLGAASATGNLQLGQIGALSQTGLNARNQDYTEFLRQTNWGTDNLQPLLDSIRAAGGNSTTTSTSNGASSPFGQIAGAGLTALGGYLQNKNDNPKPAATAQPAFTNYKPSGGITYTAP